MFDFSWSEIMLIGIVALIAIGPKDMPVALRAVSRTIKRVRRMAGEFQHHLDDMLKEADLQDVQQTFRDLRSMNPRQAVSNLVDKDGTLSRAMADPFAEHAVPPAPGSVSQGGVPMMSAREARAAAAQAQALPEHSVDAVPASPAPDFVPPQASLPHTAARPAPAFVPPASVSATPPEIRAEDL